MFRNPIIICTILTFATIHLVVGERTSTVDDPKSENSSSGEHQTNKIGTQTSTNKKRLPLRNDLIKEQRLKGRAEWRARKDNFQSSETMEDIDFHSEDGVKKLERTIERTDRKTLEEWYDYTFALKDLVSEIDSEAKRCGCTDTYEPILDTKKKVADGLKVISNGLGNSKVDGRKKKYK